MLGGTLRTYTGWSMRAGWNMHPGWNMRASMPGENTSGILHTLMLVFEHMDRVASTIAERGLNFKLREGYSAETSGKN